VGEGVVEVVLLLEMIQTLGVEEDMVVVWYIFYSGS